MKSNGIVATERISPVRNNPFYKVAAATTPLAPKSTATPPRTPVNTVTKPNMITTRSPVNKTSPVRPAPTVAASPSRHVSSPSSSIQYQQCHACHKSITSGRLIHADGLKFHGDCFNCAKYVQITNLSNKTNPFYRCHADMSVSSRYIQLHGQFLCSSCGTAAQVKSKPVCHVCRDHLVGDWYVPSATFGTNLATLCL